MKLKFNGKLNVPGQANGDFNCEVEMSADEFNLQIVKAAENMPQVLDFLGKKIDRMVADQKAMREERLKLDREEFEHRKAMDEKNQYWKEQYEKAQEANEKAYDENCDLRQQINKLKLDLAQEKDEEQEDDD